METKLRPWGTRIIVTDAPMADPQTAEGIFLPPGMAMGNGIKRGVVVQGWPQPDCEVDDHVLSHHGFRHIEPGQVVYHSGGLELRQQERDQDNRMQTATYELVDLGAIIALEADV